MRLLPLLGLLLTLGTPALLQAEGSQPPLLTIIIDDLGDRWDFGQRALALPGEITYAILPATPYSRRFAEMAHRSGREVILHQPMEALDRHRLGPAGLSRQMTRDEFMQRLRSNLDALPFVNGVSNHMGSQLTRNSEAMEWLMQEMRRRGRLYFVDSRTISDSQAQRVAQQQGVPTLSRDVFLDHVRTNSAIEARLIEAIKHSHQRGTTIAIGHPYPETLTVLEQALPRIAELGVELVSVSRMIEAHQQRSYRLWHASLSPSPTAVKSSKP